MLMFTILNFPKLYINQCGLHKLFGGLTHESYVVNIHCYNVGSLRWLSWFIVPITLVYGTYPLAICYIAIDNGPLK